MKLGRKIPYGWPIVVSCLIAALVILSFSPDFNPGYGFEMFDSKIGKIILICLFVLFIVAAIIFFINSIFVDKELEKAEKEREEKRKMEEIRRREYGQ